jgi:hypothetical protein
MIGSKRTVARNTACVVIHFFINDRSVKITL